MSRDFDRFFPYLDYESEVENVPSRRIEKGVRNIASTRDVLETSHWAETEA